MNYKLIDSTPTLAHIQFSGKFNQKNIIWDAKIQTLNSIMQNNPDSGIKQYIEITNFDKNMKSVYIGLNVKKISKSEILKTIIMITNYKNLCLGRHEFGELCFFDRNS